MNVLNTVNSSADIKKLSDEELEALASELRLFLLDSVSKTGGHLASNLGDVELTLALHRVYDTSKDRLVFDVGHQSYVHKIITGRRDRFGTLRQYGGISGFPKPYESNDDAFIAGHASNSVSVALGMAQARTLLKENYDVVAVMGDGALSGGLAYEGLSAAAASREPMVIVLNDNNMSIDPNVGGTSSLLQSMRIRPGYIRFKRLYRDVFSGLPALYSFNHEVKEWMKDKLLPVNMFSAMGLNYIGPVDGHNLKELDSALSLARDTREPVLLHVLTTKGKGCEYAESHPEIYHGVGPFDVQTGSIAPSCETFSDRFGTKLCMLAETHPELVAITAAMAGGTGLETFSRRYPNRFFDAGIAEGHATAMAGGMAKQGLLPVFAVYSSFLQRGFDMMIHDVSLLGLHVVFCVDRAGLVGSDGETHHGIFDVSYLRTVPGMRILCPASFQELDAMLETAVNDCSGPVAVRYPRGGEGEYRELHTARETVLKKGRDLTMVVYGTMTEEVLRAESLLAQDGISAEVVKLAEIDGDAFPVVLESLSRTHRLLTAEEVCDAGSLGPALAAAATEDGISLRSVFCNLGEGLVCHGSREHLLHDYGIDAEAIAAAACRLCGDVTDD